MTPHFRMVAGPNGSGKTTLMCRLAKDYAVIMRNGRIVRISPDGVETPEEGGAL